MSNETGNLLDVIVRYLSKVTKKILVKLILLCGSDMRGDKSVRYF